MERDEGALRPEPKLLIPEAFARAMAENPPLLLGRIGETWGPVTTWPQVLPGYAPRDWSKCQRCGAPRTGALYQPPHPYPRWGVARYEEVDAWCDAHDPLGVGREPQEVPR